MNGFRQMQPFQTILPSISGMNHHDATGGDLFTPPPQKKKKKNQKKIEAFPRSKVHHRKSSYAFLVYSTRIKNRYVC